MQSSRRIFAFVLCAAWGCSGDGGGTGSGADATSGGSTSGSTGGATTDAGSTGPAGSTGGSSGGSTGGSTGSATTGPLYPVMGSVTRSTPLTGSGVAQLEVLLLTKLCGPTVTTDDWAGSFVLPDADLTMPDADVDFSIDVPDGEYFLTARFDADGDGVPSSGDLVPSLCPPVQIAGSGVIGLPVDLDTTSP